MLQQASAWVCLSAGGSDVAVVAVMVARRGIGNPLAGWQAIEAA